jgi:hypothetical protein
MKEDEEKLAAKKNNVESEESDEMVRRKRRKMPQDEEDDDDYDIVMAELENILEDDDYKEPQKTRKTITFGVTPNKKAKVEPP